MPRYIGRNIDITRSSGTRDPHWDDVILLLDFDGNLTDTSPIGRTMTAVTAGSTTGGNCAISTTQQKFGTHSIAIDGPVAGTATNRVGGHLHTPHHANLLFGSGDFTIEAFIRLNVLAAGAVQDNGSVGGGYNMIATHIYFNGSTRLGWEWNVNLSNVLSFRANISSWGIVGDGTTALSADTWYHVAVCREGTKVRQFLNGALEHEATVSGSMAVPSPDQTLKIGRYALNTGSSDIARHFDGFMDSFRITKAARYTAAFTAPIYGHPNPFKQDGSHTDNKYNSGIWSISESSGDGYSINNRIQNDKWKNDPFGSSVVLFIQPRADAATIDVGPTGHTVTEVGNANITAAESRFGGYAVELDGTGDRLTVPAHDDFDFGAGDFTIELFAMFDVSTNEQVFFSSANYYVVGKNGNWVFRGSPAAGTITLATWDGQGSYVATAISGFTLSTGTWYHIAMVRISGTVTFYVDGTNAGSGTNDKTLEDGADGGLRIGHDGYSPDFNGHLDCIRITKGVGRYTGNFTVPDLGGRLYSQL